VQALTDYQVGKVFSRIALDQIASVADLERMVIHGEWRRGDKRCEGEMT
jgi:hypothetical protein